MIRPTPLIAAAVGAAIGAGFGRLGAAVGAVVGVYVGARLNDYQADRMRAPAAYHEPDWPSSQEPVNAYTGPGSTWAEKIRWAAEHGTLETLGPGFHGADDYVAVIDGEVIS